MNTNSGGALKRHCDLRVPGVDNKRRTRYRGKPYEDVVIPTILVYLRVPEKNQYLRVYHLPPYERKVAKAYTANPEGKAFTDIPIEAGWGIAFNAAYLHEIVGGGVEPGSEVTGFSQPSRLMHTYWSKWEQNMRWEANPMSEAATAPGCREAYWLPLATQCKKSQQEGEAEAEETDAESDAEEDYRPP